MVLTNLSDSIPGDPIFDAPIARLNTDIQFHFADHKCS